MLIFEHTDDAGRLHVPSRFGDRSAHVVDPGWVREGQTQRFSEANSDDVVFDFLRRGFHLWMSPVAAPGERKLVAPTGVTVRFG